MTNILSERFGGIATGGILQPMHSAGMSISADDSLGNSEQELVFDTELFDTHGGIVSLVNNAFIAQGAGKYLMCANWAWGVNAPGSGAYITPWVNGTKVASLVRTTGTNSSYGSLSGTWILDLQDGDELSVGCHPQTTSIVSRGNADATLASGCWVVKLESVSTGGGGGGGMTVTAVKTANYTAAENEVVPVDSSGGTPFTITMPATASAQSRVIVIDVGKACGTYPVTLGRNSQTFDGVAEDFVIDQDNGRVDAVSDGAGDFSTHLIGTPTLIYGRDTVGARVSRTTTQTIPTSTDEPISWENEDQDDLDFIDLGTDDTRVYITEAGWYAVHYFVRWGTATSGTRQIWIDKNGASTTEYGVNYAPAVSGQYLTQDFQTLLYCNAGDYLTAYARQTTGVGIGLDVGFQKPYLSIVKLEAVTSAPVSGSMVNLGTATVAGAAATTLTLNGLNLSAYSHFILTAKLKNATGSGVECHLTYNGDTTATNYYSQRSAHTTIGSETSVNSTYVVTLSASARLNFKGYIEADVDGYPRFSYQGVDAVGSGINTRLGSMIWTSNANVTSITITSDIASAFDIGSEITVWGVL